MTDLPSHGNPTDQRAMSAASENVLMAVQACTVDRLWPSRANVAQQTRPWLAIEETSVILHLLCCDGYVCVNHDGFYGDSYELTDRGRAAADRVIAASQNGGA